MRKIKVLQVQLHKKNDCVLADEIIRSLPVNFEVTNAFLCGETCASGYRDGGIENICFGFPDAWLRGSRLRVLWRLYRFCKQERFDMVVAHRYKPMSLFLQLNRWLRFGRVIGIQHGIGDFDRSYRKREMRRLLRENCYVVAVSQAVREYLLRANLGIDERNCVRIDNAIDIAAAERMQLTREYARRQLGLPEGSFLFGTIGRLVSVKGHIHLLEAFALIKDEFPQANVAIIGEGACRAELEAASERLGLHDRVFLLGSRVQALRYVKAFDVFVMPSLSEGLPLALLEGMSGHLPVIGSDIPALLPILEGCGGGIFPVGQADGLAECLRDSLEFTEDQLREQGERCYQYLCVTHSIEEYRRKYRQLLTASD
ncbi:glycosyltransferase [Pseudomonas flexibilis]|nr:glycosyltransferase [Pseudomonas flexibilis]